MPPHPKGTGQGVRSYLQSLVKGTWWVNSPPLTPRGGEEEDEAEEEEEEKEKEVVGNCPHTPRERDRG